MRRSILNILLLYGSLFNLVQAQNTPKLDIPDWIGENESYTILHGLRGNSEIWMESIFPILIENASLPMEWFYAGARGLWHKRIEKVQNLSHLTPEDYSYINEVTWGAGGPKRKIFMVSNIPLDAIWCLEAIQKKFQVIKNNRHHLSGRPHAF